MLLCLWSELDSINVDVFYGRCDLDFGILAKVMFACIVISDMRMLQVTPLVLFKALNVSRAFVCDIVSI